MKLRAAAATAAALPLALGLAACGSNTPQATGYKPSAPVESATAAPLKPAPVAHLNRVTFVPAMNTALTKQKSWRITGTMTANGSTFLTMSGVQTAKPLAMSMDVSGAVVGGKSAKIILVDKTLYTSIPGMTPAGKYVKAKGAEAAELRAMLDGGDPSKLFASLSSVASVKFDGTQSLGGEKLERYIVTVDTAKALKAMKQAVPPGAPKTLAYEILMDSAHRVRQLRFESSGISLKTTISDYNKPVSIKAPPASKIVR